jgi:hypothetical protein
METDAEQRLIHTWIRLCIYVNMKGFGYDKFKTCLFGILRGEHFDYIRNYPDTPLPKLATMLANRFITESRFNDAVSDLDHFERKKDETLRMAIARLRTSLEKASVIWPANQRDTIKDVELRKTLRQIVSEKARQQIDKHSLAARQQGIPLSLDRMIRLSEEEEKRSGIPSVHTAHPISLYNATTEKSSAPVIDPMNEQLQTITNMLIDMNINANESADHIQRLESDAECNAATRSMTRNAPRQSSRPYSLERAAAAVAPKRAYIAPTSTNVSYPPSTPHATPRPATPYAAPKSDVNMSQSRNDSSSNGRSRNQSYDRSSRDRSHTSMRDRQNARGDRNYERGRSRDYSDSRSRDQTRYRDYSSQRSQQTNAATDYNRGRSTSNTRQQTSYPPRNDRGRSQSRNRDYNNCDYSRDSRENMHANFFQNDDRRRNSYYQDSKWSQYDKNRGYNNNQQRYNNSSNYNNSNNYDRNRSNSRGRFQSTPVVNANDESIVNVGVSKNTGLCHLCRSTIEHSIKDCYVIRAALQQENN